ncbi:hypothetical protein PMIN03_003383 [Paraphaeosphaeria minitans]
MALIQHGWLLLALASLTHISLAGVPSDLPRLCYTGETELASSALLPCFNGPVDDGGVYGCCLAGDYCLENQACYNKYRAITYQKGCTRREYDSSNCPRKCDTDQKKADWVGVIYCNGTNGTPKDTWVCQHPDNCYAPATNCPLPDTASWDTGLEITRTTRCENIQHDKKWVAFENKLNIKTTVSLPQPSYVSAWWDAHSNYSTRWHQEIPHSQEIPYTSTRPTDSTLNATSSASGSSGPTSSNNSTTLLPEGTSASNGSKIGMAVGLGLGTPLLLAILGFLIFFLRKRRNGGDDGEQPWSGTQSGDGAVENEKVHGSTGETYDYSAKAELPADERPAPVPEMEGSSIGIVSLLLPKDSGKEDVRDHGDDKAPVYELPG